MAIENLAEVQPANPPSAENFKRLQEAVRRVLSQIAQAIQTLQSAPQISAGAVTGEIKLWGTATAPAGYLLCDGTSYKITDYPALYKAIGGTFGSVDAGHFNVPNFQGVFPRGTGTQTAGGVAYIGPALGMVQQDQLQSHRHGEVFVVASATDGANPGGSNSGLQHSENPPTGPPVVDGANGTPRTGTETRPVNLGINFIIKT